MLLSRLASVWLAITVSSAAVMLFRQQPLIDWNTPARQLFLAQTGRAQGMTPADFRAYTGCAFGDGFSYCTAATGRIGNRPWTFRPLVPFLAGIVKSVSGWGFVASFQLIASFGLIVTVGALVALAYGTARHSGVAQRDAASVAVGAALLWLATPFSLRLILTAPVLVDELATGLIIAWLAVFLAKKRRRWQWALAPPLALLATLAREVGVAGVVITCVAALILGLVSPRDAYVNSAAAAFAFAFDLSRPHGEFAGNSKTIAWRETVYNVNHPRVTLAAILMGTGIALFAVLPTCLVRLKRVLPNPRPVQALIPVAVAYLVSSIFIGSDLSRYSSAATPLLCLLLALYLVLVAESAQVMLLALAAGIILFKWQLFGVVGRNWTGYFNYFYARDTFRAPIEFVLIGFAAVLMALDYRRLRAQLVTK